VSHAGAVPSASVPATDDAVTAEAVGPLRRARAAYDRGVTRPLAWREAQLDGLARLLREGEDELVAALRADLGKSATESWLTELSFVAGEVAALRHGLRRWARDERVRVPFPLWPARARVRREPLGVVLVIAPWNYPVQLVLAPLAAAVAAGNAVVVKPSELAPATSRALTRLLAAHLDRDAIAVVPGGPDTGRALIEAGVDHVLFTGGAAGGRDVAVTAARQGVPVTLELGGKCPAIVAADATIDVAARRITWGKFLNAGQSCVAPDHVLVDRSREAELLDALVRATTTFFGPDPRRSPDYGRIVDDRHLARLAALLEGPPGRIVVGGAIDPADRYVAPTVLADVDARARVMAEEIFGPILPVVPVDGIDGAVAAVAARPDPLALYVFTGSRDLADEVVARTRSGGVCVNDTMVHLAVPGLPFGGVGRSGTGAYHGRHGFETFSQRRAVLARVTRPELGLANPPWSAPRRRLLRALLSPRAARGRGAGP